MSGNPRRAAIGGPLAGQGADGSAAAGDISHRVVEEIVDHPKAEAKFFAG